MYNNSASAFGPPAAALKESSKRTKNRRYSLQVPASLRNAWLQFRRKEHPESGSSSGPSTGSLWDLRNDDETRAMRQRRLPNSRDSTSSPQVRSSDEDLNRGFEDFDTFLHWENTSATRSGSDTPTNLYPVPRQRSKSDPRKYFGLRRRQQLGTSTGDLNFAVQVIPPSLEQLPEGIQVHHATPVVALDVSQHRNSAEELRIKSLSISTNPSSEFLTEDSDSQMRLRSASLGAYAASDERKNLKKHRKKFSFSGIFGSSDELRNKSPVVSHQPSPESYERDPYPQLRLRSVSLSSYAAADEKKNLKTPKKKISFSGIPPEVSNEDSGSQMRLRSVSLSSYAAADEKKNLKKLPRIFGKADKAENQSQESWNGESDSQMRLRSVSLSSYAAADEKKNLKIPKKKTSFSGIFDQDIIRTKSRSVDQSIAAAFDIDVIGGLSRLAESALGSTDLNDRKPYNSAPSVVDSNHRVETISYTVEGSDTLNSVAAKFQTTPSELVSINKLGSRLILPGQVILVPRVDQNPSENSQDFNVVTTSVTTLQEVVPEQSYTGTTNPTESDKADEATEAVQEVNEQLQVAMDGMEQSEDIEAERIKDREEVDKFLKLNVRHVTDGQGIVRGVLLVTPNTVIFDPNVSDPLVIERGAEAYGVIIPMDMIANAAMFHDIARMRSNKDDIEQPNDVYLPSDCKLHQKYETLNKRAAKLKQETQGKVNQGQGSLDCFYPGDSIESRGSSIDVTDSDNFRRTSSSEDKSSADETVEKRDNPFRIPIITADRPTSPSGDSGKSTLPKSDDSFDAALAEAKLNEEAYRARHYSTGAMSMETSGDRKKSLTFQPSSSTESNSNDTEPRSGKLVAEPAESTGQRMLKRLSYPLVWMGESFSSDASDSSGPASSSAQPSESMLSRVFSRRISVDSTNASPRMLLRSATLSKYRSMVSVDVPDIFASFDKLIPRPARSSEVAPLYLRLRIGRPLNKPVSQTTPVMSYGNQTIRSEYWFSIPRTKADDICRYFLLWSPGTYAATSLQELETKFDLVKVDESSRSSKVIQGQLKDESGTIGDLAKESWERAKAPYIRLFAMLRNTATLFESEQDEIALQTDHYLGLAHLDAEVYVPEQKGQSEILTEEHVKQLANRLPPRVAGATWTLAFSTSRDGCSLNTLYRKMADRDCPVLLVIKDTQANVFGAYAAAELRVSDFFYGTGETFLFNFGPDLKVYPWTGDNSYFVKGNPCSLAFGAGDGKFGLWLGSDLYQGRSQRCETFGNEPLNPNEDFLIHTVECWAFD